LATVGDQRCHGRDDWPGQTDRGSDDSAPGEEPCSSHRWRLADCDADCDCNGDCDCDRDRNGNGNVPKPHGHGHGHDHVTDTDRDGYRHGNSHGNDYDAANDLCLACLQRARRHDRVDGYRG
jgi:hypothetical protein